MPGAALADSTGLHGAVHIPATVSKSDAYCGGNDFWRVSEPPDEERDVVMSGDHDADEIRYDAIPGYRPVFFLLLLIAVGYLGWAFWAHH